MIILCFIHSHVEAVISFCETQGRIFTQLFSTWLSSSKTKYNIVQVLYHTAVQINSSFVFLRNKSHRSGVTWGGSSGIKLWILSFLAELSHFSPIWPLTSGTQVFQISNYDLKFNVILLSVPIRGIGVAAHFVASEILSTSRGSDALLACIWNTVINTTERVCFCGLKRLLFYVQMFTHESWLQSNA